MTSAGSSERVEGRTTLVRITDDSPLLPLWYKAEKNINCIANALKRAGFKRLVKGSTANVFWGHHLSEKELKALAPHQVVNHFPGSHGIGRKDYLWKNLSRMRRTSLDRRSCLGLRGGRPHN